MSSPQLYSRLYLSPHPSPTQLSNSGSMGAISARSLEQLPGQKHIQKHIQQQRWQQRQQQRRHPLPPVASGDAPATAAAASATLSPLEQLPPEGQEQWLACRQLLQQELGLEGSAADRVLTQSCGWQGQGYWRRQRVKETPDAQALSARLDYLRGLGLSSQDLAAALAEQPELAGLEVELMQKNVAYLQQRFFIKGRHLAAALRRKPRMLGILIDCSEEQEGSCQGLCTRCWAQC